MREDSSNNMQSRVTSWLTWSWKCHMLLAKVSQGDWRTTKTFITFKHLYTFLSCGPLLRSITSNIECWSPTYTHEKLNSLRWEIILNATTLLAITTVHQSTVVIFVYSGFGIALLCAHLLNQNLIFPYLKTVVQLKYSLRVSLLVFVMLLLM